MPDVQFHSTKISLGAHWGTSDWVPLEVKTTPMCIRLYTVLPESAGKNALTSELKTMGQASMAPNPIILRNHYGNFVH